MNLGALCVKTETAVLAGALKGEGFTVICTCPGWVDTDMGSRSETTEVCLDFSTPPTCKEQVLESSRKHRQGKYSALSSAEYACLL